MATKFSTILQHAVYKFKDYELATLFEEESEEVLLHFLFSSQVKFQRVCQYDLTDKNETMQEYNADLGDEEIEILSLGVAYFWCSAQVLDGDLLKNNLSNSDWSQYSPANLLSKMTELRDMLRTEFLNEITEYSYAVNDVSDMRV